MKHVFYKQHVKEIALANGFKLKEQPDGKMDLNPYVYQFADALCNQQVARIDELERFNTQLAAQRNEAIERLIELEEVMQDDIWRSCGDYVGGDS